MEPFTDHNYHNNGLDSVFGVGEEGLFLGRARVTSLNEDVGRFRTPTLRNVELTGPYMHDGRFNTLRQVIEHYRSGIQYSDSLAPQLRDGLSLSDPEVETLLVFLEALTGESTARKIST